MVNKIEADWHARDWEGPVTFRETGSLGRSNNDWTAWRGSSKSSTQQWSSQIGDVSDAATSSPDKRARTSSVKWASPSGKGQKGQK